MFIRLRAFNYRWQDVLKKTFRRLPTTFCCICVVQRRVVFSMSACASLPPSPPIKSITYIVFWYYSTIFALYCKVDGTCDLTRQVLCSTELLTWNVPRTKTIFYTMLHHHIYFNLMFSLLLKNTSNEFLPPLKFKLSRLDCIIIFIIFHSITIKIVTALHTIITTDCYNKRYTCTDVSAHSVDTLC
ncbi:hypothetical protein AGLY_001678 [Aphis glycines]|uniref:Uncharacterized protein n=1 Tax=Aphis glycines TaxID=307491 RepID=A0A6G0U5U0_APHGL|nr:hypothetical protein AGLY_001678 [Aphis glycines]